MNHDEFVRTVQSKSDLSDEESVTTAAEAVLATLSERLSHGQAADLAKDLPEHLADAVTQASGGPEAFDADEFVQRVRQREDETDTVDGAPTHVRAVLTGLAETSMHSQWNDTLSQLPAEYGHFVET